MRLKLANGERGRGVCEGRSYLSRHQDELQATGVAPDYAAPDARGQGA